MPLILILRLALSLVFLLAPVLGAYGIWCWWEGGWFRQPDGFLAPSHGPPWQLALGLLGLSWTLIGRPMIRMLLPRGADEPHEERGAPLEVRAPGGSRLHVESFGRQDGPTVILTHGWGLNSTAWYYTRRALAGRYRVITWDLPGLGRSEPLKGHAWSIDAFAGGLAAVVRAAGDGPILLVGHSIGGMTSQTFWRVAAAEVRAKVCGMALVNTTFHDPIRTAWLAPLWNALRWPVIKPACWLMIALWPLAWLSAWRGYLDGSSLLAMRLGGFGRGATRGQVDFSARLAAKGSPAVQGHGNLAMFRWSIAETLPAITVPVLVLAGGKDILTLPQASRAIDSALPVSTLIEMAGAGHMGFMEQATAYDAALIEFADRCFSAAPVSD